MYSNTHNGFIILTTKTGSLCMCLCYGYCYCIERSLSTSFEMKYVVLISSL